MNVFINEINLDNIDLFKADFIFNIVCEMNLNDKMCEKVLKEIIFLNFSKFIFL